MSESYDVRIAVRADQSRRALPAALELVRLRRAELHLLADNGKKLLRELAELSPEPVRMRTHNLLTTGDGQPALKWGSTNAYTEDAAGNPVYDWTIMDRIFDAYVEAGNIAAHPGRLHARGAVRRPRPVPAQLGARATATRRSRPAGPRRPTTSGNGAASSKPGRGTWPTATARTRSRPGPGKSGTSPTATTGPARSPSSARCTTRRRRRSRRVLPRRPRRRPAHLRRLRQPEGADLPARVPPARRRHRLADRLHRLPRQGQPGRPRRPRPHGAGTSSCATSRPTSRSSTNSPSSRACRW